MNGNTPDTACFGESEFMTTDLNTGSGRPGIETPLSEPPASRRQSGSRKRSRGLSRKKRIALLLALVKLAIFAILLLLLGVMVRFLASREPPPREDNSKLFRSEPAIIDAGGERSTGRPPLARGSI